MFSCIFTLTTWTGFSVVYFLLLLLIALFVHNTIWASACDGLWTFQPSRRNFCSPFDSLPCVPLRQRLTVTESMASRRYHASDTGLRSHRHKYTACHSVILILVSFPNTRGHKWRYFHRTLQSMLTFSTQAPFSSKQQTDNRPTINTRTCEWNMAGYFSVAVGFLCGIQARGCCAYDSNLV